MTDSTEEEPKVEIQYPCQWTYKIIGFERETVRDVAEAVFYEKQYLLTYSKQSRTGKYHSWAIDVVVDSPEERDGLFLQLKASPAVKMVI